MATSTINLHDAPAVGFEQPFEMLMACHERVERTLALLQRLAAHVAAQGTDESARQAAADVLRYFDRAAPAHHEDEERHVLPALRRSGQADWVELAERLQREHEGMARAWAELRPALADLAQGHWESATAARNFARWQDFAALYVEHIAIENGLAFGAASSLLDEPARQAMGVEMARRRGILR